MDRRNFFRSALNKGSASVVKAVETSVKKQASHWIRPPFAINELEFLLACTRCGDCVDACPHNVIFNLSAKLGMKFVGTPALDLLNKGCHLCEDWPCVSACTANALLRQAESETDSVGAEDVAEDMAETIDSNRTDRPASAVPISAIPTTPIPMPKLAKASIDSNVCLPFSGPECGACIYTCPVDGALRLDMAKPVIDEALCTGCALCRESCITEPKAINIASL